VFHRNFVPRMHHFKIFAFEKYRDLETRVRGHSRSSKVIPFDRPSTTSLWRSMVTGALSGVIFADIFKSKYNATLKSG